MAKVIDMDDVQRVLDPFAGSGGWWVSLFALGALKVLVKFWLDFRRQNRLDRELAMIGRAAFEDRRAVQALERLLPDHRAKPSAAQGDKSEDDDAGSVGSAWS